MKSEVTVHIAYISMLSLLLLVPCSIATAEDGDILERTVLPAKPGATATCERIIYESDGLRIVGYLAYPSDAPDANSPLPCVVFNRGGNRDFGEMTPERFAWMGNEVAGWGYVLFASNYRGSTGSEGADEFGGDDVHDVINGLSVLDHLSFADGTRIGMWGHSRGGLMTYLALMQTDRIKAAIIGAGVADMRRGIELRPEMETRVLAELRPNWETDREAVLEKLSPVRRVEELPSNVPILLVHGTADWRVDPRDSMDMAQALYGSKRPFRLIMLEGADHSISEHRGEYNKQVHAWLDYYVRDLEDLPELEPHGR